VAKIKIQYSCQSCGHQTLKWLGKCPACDAWNSFLEETVSNPSDSTSLSDVRQQFRSVRESAYEAISIHGPLVTGQQDWVDLDVSNGEETGALKPAHLQRLTTGISELNRVLGGGLVPDSFILLGGDPGIGKSTLLLQMTKGIRENHPQVKILYVSGEESIDQIRGRAHRLGIRSKGQIFLAAETQLERVFASIKELRPEILIMDSLQTFSTGSVQSAPGSVSQVREVAARLMALAKSAGISVWLVGHVTKEGSIAGPKTVEHMVDTVLYFEGEGGQSHRLLRTVKNRFGSTRELGVFEMDGEGLREVTNPSSLFLSERKEALPGTAIAAPLEGSRPLLVELQALVSPSGLAIPRRTSVGIDSARVSLLAAILEKHMKLSLAEQDLFFNVAGGLRLNDPACDLAAAAAIWSSAEDRALPLEWIFIGELGLTGEVRRVSQTDLRIEEARRLGFKTVVLPQNTPKSVLDAFSSDTKLKIRLISKIDEIPRLFA
jgi:DNA repair protein RadA/Sms